MKKIIIALVAMVYLSSCYTVTKVGNCKYYYRGPIGSKGKAHQLIGL